MPDTPERYEKMKLNFPLLRSWYGKSLVGGTVPQATGATTEESEPAQAIEAPRHEVLVFLRPLPPAQHDKGMKFLSEILKACKLSIDGVALFEGPGPGDLDSLRNICNPRAMILFGIEPPATGLPLHFPHFQPTQHGGIKLLSAPAIEELFDDKQLKSKLWTGLKTIFGL